MKIEGQLTEEETVKMIGDRLLLSIMKGITEDEVYDEKQKYVILEGMLSQWQ